MFQDFRVLLSHVRDAAGFHKFGGWPQLFAPIHAGQHFLLIGLKLGFLVPQVCLQAVSLNYVRAVLLFGLMQQFVLAHY